MDCGELVTRHRPAWPADGEWSTPLSPEEINRASALYAQKCAACHGRQKQGGPVGPSLLGVGSRYSLAKIERIAQRGKGRKKAQPMPSGLVTAAEASLLARWLATSQSGPAQTPEPDKSE
jgi:mono/diheme cytochrome c family protein